MYPKMAPLEAILMIQHDIPFQQACLIIEQGCANLGLPKLELEWTAELNQECTRTILEPNNLEEGSHGTVSQASLYFTYVEEALEQCGDCGCSSQVSITSNSKDGEYSESQDLTESSFAAAQREQQGRLQLETEERVEPKSPVAPVISAPDTERKFIKHTAAFFGTKLCCPIVEISRERERLREAR
jgi:hypothetical protein